MTGIRIEIFSTPQFLIDLFLFGHASCYFLDKTPGTYGGDMARKFRTDFVILKVMLSSLFLVLIIIMPALAFSAERDYWPTDNWRHSSPEAQCVNSEKLLQVLPFIIENLPDIQSLLVVRNGYMIFENYYGLGMPDRQDTVHSVTKSITSALFGIAKDQGLIGDLSQTLPNFWPQHFDAETIPAKKKITLEHLLTMTAGLQAVKVKDWSLLMEWHFSPDRVKFTLELPQSHPPGEKFAYSNPITHLLAVILENKAGTGLVAFADQNLFKHLGIKPRLWKQDAQGHNTGHGGLYLSARQMAKFGFLYLNDGIWDGKQIISADWIEKSTRGQVTAGANYEYGYQWWVRPVAGCRSYRAWGRNGQFVVVVPELDLVIAVTSKTGLPGKPSGHYSPLFDIVTEAVSDKRCPTQNLN